MRLLTLVGKTHLQDYYMRVSPSCFGFMDALTTMLVMSMAKRSRTLLRSHSDDAPPLCMFSTMLLRMRRVSGKASLHVSALIIILNGMST